MGKMIKLKDAVGNYNPESGISHDYEWYRWHAHSFGKIRIGQIEVPTHKENRSWVVDSSELCKAIDMFKETNAADKKPSELKGSEYHENAPKPEVRNFRLVSNVVDIARKCSNGTWYCNTCNLPAETEHNNPECHTCSDWHGCGQDCTLSRVFCTKCGKSQSY